MHEQVIIDYSSLPYSTIVRRDCQQMMSYDSQAHCCFYGDLATIRLTVKRK